MENKKIDYLVLINGENRMPDGFEETVEKIPVKNAFDESYLIEKKTYEAFLRLQKELLEKDGIQAELISVYRSVKEQTEAFEKNLREKGEEYTYKYVAKPGHSEHHTGIAIDVGIVKDGELIRGIENLLDVDDEFQIVHEKLPRYGFILRYPKAKEDVTKIGYEPWHYRYIDSPEIAQEITRNGLCFEEYCEK